MTATPTNPDANLPAAEQFKRIAADMEVVRLQRGSDMGGPFIRAHFYNRSVDAARALARETAAALA